MKLLIDMNLSPRWVNFFSDNGIQAIHWSNVGSFNAPDSEIMSFARSNSYVVVTNDLDFSAILAATNGEKPSVVQIRSEDLNPGAIGSSVVEALNQMSVELADGALLTVDPSRVRLRLLPLK